jgi:hypothetical protein
VSVASEQDVLWLEVTVHEPEHVQALESEEHLAGVEPRGGDGLAASRAEVF